MSRLYSTREIANMALALGTSAAVLAVLLLIAFVWHVTAS